MIPARSAPRASDAAIVDALNAARRVAERLLGPGPDADDVVQQVAESLLRSRDRLTHKNLSRYAEVAARNAVINGARGREREVPTPGLAMPAADVLPEEAAVLGAEHRAVRAATDELDPQDVELLRQTVIDDIPIGRVAIESGRSSRAESLRLLRAKSRLRVSTLLHFRAYRDLDERCRQILLALSARDMRRAQDLDAAGHLQTCSRCAELAPVLRARDREALGLAVPATAAGGGGLLARLSGSRPVQVGIGAVAVPTLVAGAVLAATHQSPASAPSPSVHRTAFRFAHGQAALSRRSDRRLHVFVGEITGPSVRVTVTGYADPRGSASYNRRLSMRRARVVGDEVRRLRPRWEIHVRAVGESTADRHHGTSSRRYRAVTVVVRSGR